MCIFVIIEHLHFKAGMNQLPTLIPTLTGKVAEVKVKVVKVQHRCWVWLTVHVPFHPKVFWWCSHQDPVTVWTRAIINIYHYQT